MEQYFLDTLYITGCAVQNKKAHIRENMDVERTLRESYGQSCSLMILYGLVSAENIEILEHAEDMREYLAERMAKEAARQASIAKMINTLDEKGFDPIVIKGPVLASLYPDPALREFGDIDLFFDDEEKCHDAAEYLISLGGKIDGIEGMGKHDCLYFPGVGKVEIHYSLYEEDFKRLHLKNESVIKEPFEKIALRNGEEMITFGKTDTIKYIFCHMMGHFLFNRCDLKQVCDILLYLKTYRTEIDRIELLRFLDETGYKDAFATVVGAGIEYLSFSKEELMDVGYSHETVRLFLEDCFAGCTKGVWGKNGVRRGKGTVSIELNGSKKELLKKVRRGVFPEKRFLKGMYPYCERHPMLIPIAWGENIIDLARGALLARGRIRGREPLLRKMNIK